MSEQQQPMSVQALVEAIDQRARQAGTEGATTVLRGLLGTVADTLASIEGRLGSLEEQAVGAAPGLDALASTIDERLVSLNTRLVRLEEAFVRAVEDSSAGTVSVSDRVVEAVTAYLEQALPDLRALPPGSDEPDRPRPATAEQLEQLGAQLISALDQLRPVLPAAADPAVAPVAIEEGLAAVQSGMDRLERLVAEQPAPAGPDPELRAILGRVAADVERLLRQEQSGRVVQLVEDRLSAGLDAVVRRVEAVGTGLEGLAEEGRRQGEELAGARADILRAVAAVTQELGQELSSGLGRLDTALTTSATRAAEALDGAHESMEAALERRTKELATAAAVDGVRHVVSDLGSQVSGVEATVADRVRNEAEQLTQRVAALASSVERLRLAVDALAEESAQSLGRRATEVGRKGCRLGAEAPPRCPGRRRPGPRARPRSEVTVVAGFVRRRRAR